MGNFKSIDHLIGRYPELSSNAEFLNFVNKYGGDIWYETKTEQENVINVILQSSNGLYVFAANIRRNFERPELSNNEVLKIAEFDLTESGLGATNAAMIAKNEIGFNNSQIHSIRPIVSFDVNPPEIFWEIEIISDEAVRSFLINQSQKLVKSTVFQIKKNNEKKISQAPSPQFNDWLEENECHHLTLWRSLAQSIIKGATNPADKAFAIWIYVRQKMLYDSTITHIGEFTWSDNLVINQNNWRGICDEWAVVQITLLRAVGVPATLKFLIWQNGSQTVGHACLEWSDNGTWRHMDALWNAFDNRARYRQSGAANVRVMDGTSPLDARYNGLAWGVLDVQGDQKFYPYGDFLINPSYPGNQRPGYSY